MSFDFSTLITDRAQKDVDGKTEKGFYNASDLNRVTECMEYLDAELRGLGYESGYESVVVHPEESAGRLPEGYIELEYIESTGTQYIDTGVYPGSESRVTLNIEVLNTSPSTCGIFGSRNSSGSIEECFALWSVNNLIRTDYGSNGLSTNVNALQSLSIDKKKSITIINGQEFIQNAITFHSLYPLTLLAVNQLGGVDQRKPSAKLLFSKVYTGDILERDYIPCKNPSGEVGLYDLVSNGFFGNSGTGQFIAGPDVIFEPDQEPLDPYTWYESDVPTASQMAQYLANVAAIRSVFTLPDDAPQTPESMALLTFAKANDIESVLQYVETTIQQTVKGMARSNSFTFWSGNHPFPTAESNKGRNWAELDAMKTGWRNWQLSTWYLLLYGNLKAEGDVS